MACKEIWPQAFLFACGAVVGFFVRDLMYWQGGLHTNAIFWLHGQLSSGGQVVKQLSSGGQVVKDAMASCPPRLPPPTCRCPRPAPADQLSPTWQFEFAPQSAQELSQPAPKLRPPAPAVWLPEPSPELAPMCKVARDAAVNEQVLLFIGDHNVFKPPDVPNTLISLMMTSLIDLGVNNILFVAIEYAAFLTGSQWIPYCKKRGIALHVLLRVIPTPGVLDVLHIREKQSAKKFPIVRDLLQCRVNVLLSDLDVLFWDNPFKHIVGDADVEGMTDGWDSSTKFGYAYQKPANYGFQRWQHREVFLNSGFFYVRVSQRTIETMNATWDMLTKFPIWDQAAYNCQLHAPLGTTDKFRLHGRGLTVRVMDVHVFSNSRAFHMVVDPATAHSHYEPADLAQPSGFSWPTRWGRPVAMHVNYHLHKTKIMAYARRAFAQASGPSKQPLLPPRAGRAELPPAPPSLAEMCRVARKAAVNRQVLVFVGDSNVISLPSAHDTLLYTALTTLIELKVGNVLLVATDPEAYANGKKWIAHARDSGVPLHVIERNIGAPGVLGESNHSERQAAKKYLVLRDLLLCNVNALLSEAHAVFWGNPFRHIHGDADLEGMTNGWDYNSIFGFEVELNGMKWFPPWEWRVDFLSSGFFYVRASTATIKTMDAIWNMRAKERISDFVAFNLQVRAPLGTGDHDRLAGQGLSIRVMNVFSFPNSRVFHMMVDPDTLNSEYLPSEKNAPAGFTWPTPWKRPIALNVNMHRHKAAMMAFARRAFPPANTSR